MQIFRYSAARLVTITRKYDDIGPILRSLHWLPVHQLIILSLFATPMKLFALLRLPVCVAIQQGVRLN